MFHGARPAPLRGAGPLRPRAWSLPAPHGPAATKNSEKTLKVPNEVVQALEKQRARARGPFVWHSRTGRPLQRRNVSKAFDWAQIGMNDLDRLNLHGLRHTAATLMLTASQPVHEVARYLGHSPQPDPPIGATPPPPRPLTEFRAALVRDRSVPGAVPAVRHGLAAQMQDESSWEIERFRT